MRTDRLSGMLLASRCKKTSGSGQFWGRTGPTLWFFFWRYRKVPRTRQDIEYGEWLRRLRDDAQRAGLRRNLDELSDYVLNLFWRDGYSPTIDSITGCAMGDGQ
jgi:hypothetical protein